MKALALISLLVLSACGGGSHDVQSTTTTPSTSTSTPTTPTTPVTMVDAFFTAVMSLIGDGAETSTEPQATDTVMVTAPDDTEPVAVK